MAVVPHCSTFPSVSITVQGLSNSGFVLACLHTCSEVYPEHLPMCWMLWQMQMGAWHDRGKHRAGVTVSGKLTNEGGGVCVRPVTWSSKSSATWGEVSWRPGHVMRVALCSPATPPSFTGQAKRQPCERRNWVRMPVMRGNCMPLLRSPEDLRGDGILCSPTWMKIDRRLGHWSHLKVCQTLPNQVPSITKRTRLSLEKVEDNVLGDGKQFNLSVHPLD